MSTAIRVFVIAAIATLLAYFSWPWLKNALYLGQLLAWAVPLCGCSGRAAIGPITRI